MKKYIDSKLQKMRSAKNAHEGYIDVCSDVMEQYDAGKISSGEALEVIKNCLKNISKIKVLPSALAQLWRNKLTTIATILTVAIVTLLIVITNTVKDIAIEKQVTWIDKSGADIVLGNIGTDLVSNSFIPTNQLEVIKNTPGVKQAQGFIYYFYNTYGENNRYLTLTIQGYDPNVGFAGPWELVEGRTVESNNEIVLDESLKTSLGSTIGQSVNLAGHTYTLVGFSRGTQGFGKQTVFITDYDALNYLTKSPYYHYILIKSDNIPRLVSTFKNQGFTTMTTKEFSNNTKRYWSQEIAPTMWLITTASISFGLIILILLFTLTFRFRKKDIAIMKSAGATNQKIVSIEFMCLGISTSLGMGLGIGLSCLGMMLIGQTSAGFNTGLSGNSYLIGTIFTVAVLATAFIPTLLIVSKIKPLIVKKKLYGITLFSLQD